MFSAITGAMNGRSNSFRMNSRTKSSRDAGDETVEHKNRVIDALTAELTQKVT